MPRLADEPLAVDDVDLAQREVLQPALHVRRVNALEMHSALDLGRLKYV